MMALLLLLLLLFRARHIRKVDWRCKQRVEEFL